MIGEEVKEEVKEEVNKDIMTSKVVLLRSIS
jgi:hypothetical protein